MAQNSKEVQDRITAVLKQWLAHEDETIEMTNKIASKTDNPTVKLFMDIIRTDSSKHKRIQQYLIDSLEGKTPPVSEGDIDSISGLLNEHLRLEQQVVPLSAGLAEVVSTPVQAQLFDYLREDESKHTILLETLAKFKDWATSRS